jgi:Xaa-Pro aminopeptidase
MIKERLAALRALMQQHNISACIVPGTDPHASEYMAPHWTEMSWITGFLGETGTAVITLDKALLWTDSRYYLQAEAELEGTTVELMRESDVDCPSIPEWLCGGDEVRGRRRAAIGRSQASYRTPFGL